MPPKLFRLCRREQQSNHSVNRASTTATPSSDVHYACHPPKQPTSCFAPSTDTVLQKLASLLSQPTVSPQSLASTNPADSNSVPLQMLTDLKLQFERFEKTLDAIKKKQKRQGQQLEDLIEPSSPTSSTETPNFRFPLRRMQDFDQLDLSLSNPQTKKSLMNLLARFKSLNVPDLVRMYLRHLIDQSLRNEFTYAGTPEKRCFHTTEVHLLIQECVAHDPDHQPHNYLLVNDAIKKWFRDGRKRFLRGTLRIKKPRYVLSNDENGNGASPELALVVKPDTPLVMKGSDET